MSDPNTKVTDSFLLPMEFPHCITFPPKTPESPREIEHGGVIWKLGVDHIDGRPSTKLNIRHGRILFTLLSFMDESRDGIIEFSFREFTKKFTRTGHGSSKINREIVQLLHDLKDCYCERITPSKDNPGKYDSSLFSLVESISCRLNNVNRKGITALDKDEAIKRLNFEYVRVSQQFWDYLTTSHQNRIRLDVINKMTSPIAQSLYSFLPSRSTKATQARPWEMTFTHLLELLNKKVPKHKSRSIDFFCRDRKRDGSGSVIEQLDGQKIVDGTLHVKVANTADGKDCKIQVWCSNTLIRPHANTCAGKTGGPSKITEAWLKSGRTVEALNKRLEMVEGIELEDYEKNMMSRCGVYYRDSVMFLRQMKACLGIQQFHGIMSELNSDVKEGRGPDNPTKAFIWRLLNCLGQPNEN